MGLGVAPHNRSRRAVFLLLAVGLLATSCGGGDEAASDEPQDVGEPSAESAGSLTTTSTTRPGTSTTSTTTTTTTAPVTTTTESLVAMDWEVVDLEEIVRWYDSGEIPEGFYPSLTASCKDAIFGLATLGTALAEGAIPVLEVAVAVENGERPVSDASDAFLNYGNAAALLGVVAGELAKDSDLGAATLLADELKGYFDGLSFSSGIIGIAVYDVEAGTVDQEGINVFLPGWDQDSTYLLRASTFAWPDITC